MKPNALSLFNAMQLYWGLVQANNAWKSWGNVPAADEAACATAIGLAYTRLMTAIGIYNANPDK